MGCKGKTQQKHPAIMDPLRTKYPLTQPQDPVFGLIGFCT